MMEDERLDKIFNAIKAVKNFEEKGLIPPSLVSLLEKPLTDEETKIIVNILKGISK